MSISILISIKELFCLTATTEQFTCYIKNPLRFDKITKGGRYFLSQMRPQYNAATELIKCLRAILKLFGYLESNFDRSCPCFFFSGILLSRNLSNDITSYLSCNCFYSYSLKHAEFNLGYIFSGIDLREKYVEKNYRLLHLIKNAVIWYWYYFAGVIIILVFKVKFT